MRIDRSGIGGHPAGTGSAVARLPPMTDGETDHRADDPTRERPDGRRHLEVEQSLAHHAATHTEQYDAPRRRAPPEPAKDGGSDRPALNERGTPRLVEVVGERAELSLRLAPTGIASPARSQDDQGNDRRSFGEP